MRENSVNKETMAVERIILLVITSAYSSLNKTQLSAIKKREHPVSTKYDNSDNIFSIMQFDFSTHQTPIADNEFANIPRESNKLPQSRSLQCCPTPTPQKTNILSK